ncbi:MAG: hypothetical protein ACI9LE_000321 [Paraglaciecola sp.]|jgi:hypothetical protein
MSIYFPYIIKLGHGFNFILGVYVFYVQSNIRGDCGNFCALIYALERHMKKKWVSLEKQKLFRGTIILSPDKFQEANTAALSYNKFSNQDIAPSQLTLSPKTSNMLLNACREELS